jgi:TonB family protein
MSAADNTTSRFATSFSIPKATRGGQLAATASPRFFLCQNAYSSGARFRLLISGALALKKMALRYRLFQLCAELLMLTGSYAFSQTPSTDPATNPNDAAPEMQFEGDQQSWARVTRIVPPKYPKEALEKNIGGTVDIEVLIGEDGYMKEVRSLESTPKNVQFEEATRDVLKLWTFGIKLSMRCQPVETVGSARLEFSVQDGKEQISLSHRKQAVNVPVPVGRRLVSINYKDVVSNVVYPQVARRVGAMADVWVVAVVDSPSGKVTSAEVSAIKSNNAKSYERFFAQSAEDAVKELKYQPMADYARPIKICVPFKFRLK